MPYLETQLPTGRQFWLCSITGEVVDSESKTHTTVSSSGGIPYKVGDAVYTTPVHVHSSQFTDRSLWIRDDQGKETSVAIGELPLKFRVGHRVTLAWGSKKGNQNGYTLAAENHTTSQFVVRGREMEWRSICKRSVTAVWALLAVFAICAIGGAAYEYRSQGLSWLAAVLIAPVLGWIVYAIEQGRASNRQYDAAVARLLHFWPYLSGVTATKEPYPEQADPEVSRIAVMKPAMFGVMEPVSGC